MSEERSVLDYLVAYAYAEIDAAIRNALADDDTPSVAVGLLINAVSAVAALGVR